MIIDADFVDGLIYAIASENKIQDIKTLRDKYREEYITVTVGKFEEHSSLIVESRVTWEQLHKSNPNLLEKRALYNKFDRKVREIHLSSSEFSHQLKEFQKIFGLLDAEIERLSK